MLSRARLGRARVLANAAPPTLPTARIDLGSLFVETVVPVIDEYSLDGRESAVDVTVVLLETRNNAGAGARDRAVADDLQWRN